jgi:Cu/Ag efflux protein CusF
MIALLCRPLGIGLLPIAFIACTNSVTTSAERAATVPLGVDLSSSGPVIATAQFQTLAQAATPVGDQVPRPSGGLQMAHEGHNDAHGTGTVNSVDQAQHKVNLSHQPIPAIGWPAMTMEFPVAPSIDLRAIKPGTRVNFTIEQQPGGMYEIKAIAPAGGGR